MLRDLLLLTRAPLAASAASNLVVGALLSRPPGSGWRNDEVVALALLAVASCCAYWGGMVMNDRFDLERDRALHPGRPLASGRVSASLATTLGAALLVGHVLLATLAGYLVGQDSFEAAAGARRGFVGGAVLVACVLAYDGWLKKERLPGALAMAGCRFVNVLLGVFVLGLWPGKNPAGATLLYALLLGIYVVYLTVLSFYEDSDAPPEAVATGLLGTVLPPALIALATLAGPVRLHPLALVGALPLLFLTLYQGFSVIERGTRARGESGTRALLRGIWLFDVALLLGMGHWLPAAVAAGAAVGAIGMAMLVFAPPARPASPG